MSINITNIKKKLKSMNLQQLQEEKEKVEKKYSKQQIAFLPQTELDSWNIHISLIEEEISFKKRSNY